MNARFFCVAGAGTRGAVLLVAAVALLGSLTGCGTGGYEERLSRCVRTLNAAANELQKPSPVLGANFTIRLPGTCQAALDNSADPRRTKPGPIALPGSSEVYEVLFRDSTEGLQPYYLYVGSVGGQSLAQVAADLQKQLKAQFTEVGDWSDFQGKTTEGATNQWRKLRATGKQVFYYRDKAGAETYPTQEGLLEIYLRQEAGAMILVVWRMPKDLEANSQLSRWAPLVAGSLKAK